MTTDTKVELIADPIKFSIGKRTTNPELATMTLSVDEARKLGRNLLRAAEGE